MGAENMAVEKMGALKPIGGGAPDDILLPAPTRVTPRMTWRAVARSATMEMRGMMPAFARDRPPSSLLNPTSKTSWEGFCGESSA